MPLNGSSGSARAWLLVILGFGGIAGLTVLLLRSSRTSSSASRRPASPSCVWWR